MVSIVSDCFIYAVTIRFVTTNNFNLSNKMSRFERALWIYKSKSVQTADIQRFLESSLNHKIP